MSELSLRDYLKILADSPSSFTPEMCYRAVMEIMDGKTQDAQIASFLTFLRAYGYDRNYLYIAQSAKAMKDKCKPIHTDKPTIDIVGTGGDGKDTFNVSTASSIIGAASGCIMAKHGNRASSSASGSADVLEKMGCILTKVTPETAKECLDKLGFCFLFAPNFHPAMGNAAKSRKDIGFRTIFNLIGPLSNPVESNRCIVGVARYELGETIAKALISVGIPAGWVVCGDIGLDEISPEGCTTVWAFGKESSIPERHQNLKAKLESSKNIKKEDYVIEFKLDPKIDFDIEPCTLDLVSGGNADENATIMENLLQGKLKCFNDKDISLDKEDPIVRFVLLNSAAVVFVAGLEKDLKLAVKRVRSVISTGKGWELLESFKTMIAV